MKAERIKHKMTKNDMRLCYLRSKHKTGVGYSEFDVIPFSVIENRNN